MIDCYYTAAPIEFESALDTQKTEPEADQMICYKGVPMYVRPYDASHYQVVGLCTTDPAHYLKKDMMPGALIPLVNIK